MKIELLSPAGSMANLKAAIVSGADSVYLGMQDFTARQYATNFNEKYLLLASKLCKSNNVKIYLTMNTLVKNNESGKFINQLSYAYSAGIDAVIIQHPSLIKPIRKSFPDLHVHISTQAGVMNSAHATLLAGADRINLARELTKEDIISIRENFPKELEVFCHGALCVCVSGSCLFSSLLGGRSGNRGRCAQPCRKKYNDKYLLSTKELCLIRRIPELIEMKINSLKIEGRMRSPYYVATATSTYRKAIDSYYEGNFSVSDETIKELEKAFSREFTEGLFSNEEVLNPKESFGKREAGSTIYSPQMKDIEIKRKKIKLSLPRPESKKSSKKMLIVRAYSKKDAFSAYENGADIIYYDLFADDFSEVSRNLPAYAVTPRIMLDKDLPKISELIRIYSPKGILAGNQGMLSMRQDIPLHLDYNANTFNDIDLSYQDCLPIISPELSINELIRFKNKEFITLVHGKIRLMTLRHKIEGTLCDDKGRFIAGKIFNGSEILNEKELGLFNQAKLLLSSGINKFLIDTEKDVGKITSIYRKILDKKDANTKDIQKKYIMGWSAKGVL